MRLFITIFCFIVCCSCHNKSDLKRIAELEKENKELRYKVNKIENIYGYDFTTRIMDSIFFPDGRTACYGFYEYLITSNSRQQRIQLNKESYNSQIRFGIDISTENINFSYSIPQKINSDIVNYIDISNDNHFSFIPKDTGWYYWKGLAKLTNPRTEEVKLFSFTDSFYVYK